MVRTAEEFAEALARASDSKQAVVIRGAGTKAEWGPSRRSREATKPEAGPTVISTLGLNRVLAHEHGDLTATIEAGASLRDVNAALARHGQWLPLDPSFADAATIGGILATNDSGPLRHRYGTPRDLVIGIRVATGDGVLAKAGGQVVKNVAGYDLSKLVTGSFGSLAAIVSATFKLSPLPKALATLVVTPRDEQHAGEIVREVMASQLEPIAFEIRQQALVVQAFRPALEIVLRFASLPAAIEAQMQAASAMATLKGCTTSTRDPFDLDAIWRSPGAILRAAWLPANTARLLATLKGCTTSTGDPTRTGDVELAGRAVVGAGLIRIGGDDDTQRRGVEHLHASGFVGNIVVLRGSDALKERWGVRSALPALTAALKHAFDPAGVLI